MDSSSLSERVCLYYFIPSQVACIFFRQYASPEALGPETLLEQCRFDGHAGANIGQALLHGILKSSSYIIPGEMITSFKRALIIPMLMETEAGQKLFFHYFSLTALLAHP